MSYADSSWWMDHDTYASGMAYGGFGIVSKNFTAYGAEHTAAIARWNDALPRDYLVEFGPSFPNMRQYVVYTSSQADFDLAAWYDAAYPTAVYSCDSLYHQQSQYPWRAFEFGHTPGNGDRAYTVICLNHSDYLTCPQGQTCNYFNDSSVTTETRIKGLVHEMGHALHLAHPLIANKGAMDQYWAYPITQQEALYVHFAYAIGHRSSRVRQALNLPGESPGYYECLTSADWNDFGAGPIAMRAYCYVDVPGIPINPEIGTASGDGVPGVPPPGPYGDVDDRHAELTGFVDGTWGTVAVAGCFEDRDSSGPLGHIYVEWLWNTATGTGTADTWVEIANVNDCLNGSPPGAPDASGSLQLDDTSYAENLDSDGDGCTDARELGDTVSPGAGLRDPFNPYDYYDINHDGAITSGVDVLGVAQAFGSPGVNSRYIDYKDRGLIVGSHSWNKNGPNNNINSGGNVLGVAAQFGHGCLHTTHSTTTAFGPHPAALAAGVGSTAPVAMSVSTTAGYPSTGQLLVDAETLTYDQNAGTCGGGFDPATQFCVTGRGSMTPAGNNPAAHNVNAILWPKP